MTPRRGPPKFSKSGANIGQANKRPCPCTSRRRRLMFAALFKLLNRRDPPIYGVLVLGDTGIRRRVA